MATTGSAGPRRLWILVALGVLAFVALLVATLPASLMVRFLPPTVQMAGLSGSVWSGNAERVIFQRRELGSVRWNCKVLPLFSGRLRCEIALERVDGRLDAVVTAQRGELVDIEDAHGSLPVAMLGEGIAAPGWTGNADLSIERLRLARGWPVAISGGAVFRGLRAPGARGLEIGNYELTLGEGEVGSNALSGRIRDLGGPFRVRGTISLKPDRSYLLQGDIAPGPGADERFLRVLSFLGEPDSAGRRPFAIEGTL